jgi:hypothetical protein
MKIIVKVENFTGKEWISNLVITEKPNGNLRLCIDPIELNKAIVRQYYNVPTISETASKLSNQTFTVFDLKEGFHQVMLDEESSLRCSFSSPCGCYRYTRMPYGISCVPENFQNLVEKNFGDISGTVIYFDDLLSMGKTEEEHNQVVVRVVNEQGLWEYSLIPVNYSTR